MKTNLLSLLALHLGLAAGVAQPVITNQPTWQTNFIGGTATFSVGATGTPPLLYQWRSHANPISYTNIPFGTEATLVLTNVQATQRRFAVVVTDAGGLSATSSPLVSYTVVTPPSITPAHPTASLFTDVTLYATNGSGAARSSYQWLLNGEPIAGAVTNRLVVTNVQPTNAGAAYAIVVTYAFGSVTSQVATLTITPFPITPANPTASLFADVTLLFTNSSGPPLSYQWLFNGEPLAGAVTKELVVTNVQKTNAGDYATVVTYAFGSVTSQVATLKITPFNSMYCFGFSWTATYIPGLNPPDFYHNHACNGPMWPEFLSTNLGLAYVEANNYAIGGSTPTQILNQVLSFLVPQKPKLSLYCIMAALNFDTTNEATWSPSVQRDMLTISNAVNQLYTKGARTILIESQFVLDLQTLQEVGTNTVSRSKLHEIDEMVVSLYNAALFESVGAFARTRSDLRILWVDMLSNLDAVVANPSQYGFTKADIDALADPLLTDKSFTGPGADYVFWDYRHGTSKLNKLIEAWHLEALRDSVLETLDVKVDAGVPKIQMNHLQIGRDYTLQKSSDLTSWNEVQTFTASAGTNAWTGVLEGAPSVFYRMKWQP